MRFVLIFLILIFTMQNIFAAHYITGVVNDALDGTSANDLSVVLWNPANGAGDNLTDVVGENGNSGQDNLYMIDCEGLATPCEIGDSLNVKVFSYPYSKNVSVVVTGAGFDAAPNASLNSVPITNPFFPLDFGNISSQPIIFNCSFEDLDLNLKSVSLYGNWSSGWHLNETKNVSGGSGSILFSKNLEEGIYKWGCRVEDDLSVFSFSENNFTITVDRTPPLVNLVTVNETFSCGVLNVVRVTCNTNDSIGIERVIIEAKKPSLVFQNYSSTFLSEDNYFADILLDEIGSWSFNCISNDFANNSANLTFDNFEVYSDFPELSIYPEINFSNLNPFEGENIFLNATVLNTGCSDANNFFVGFFEGNPLSGNQIGNNQTVSISGLSNKSVNISWDAKVGPTNFFIFADVGNSINEANETNNYFNQSFDVGVWQEFYGNVSGMKILSDGLLSNLSTWGEEPNLNGNVFMTDVESEIDWTSLVSIGRKKTGEESSNDFNEIDSFLGTGNFQDSVENVFTINGEPLLTRNLTIHQKEILYVPVVNSTNNSNFVTGILWDSSDDSDGEYGSFDKEDIVFVAELNKGGSGTYGNYDYEIKVPVNLRSYDSSNNEEVYLYYDLI